MPNWRPKLVPKAGHPHTKANTFEQFQRHKKRKTPVKQGFLVCMAEREGFSTPHN